MPKPVKKVIPEVPSVDPAAPLKIEKEDLSDEPESAEFLKLKRKNGLLLIVGSLFFVLIFACVSVLGFLYFKPETKSQTSEGEVLETQESPEPKLELNRGNITFEVMNASGVTGAAGSAAEKLEGLGYKIGAVDNLGGEFTGFEVFLSEDLLTFKDLIIEDLNKDFPGISYKSGLKGESLARLVIGTEELD